MLRDKPRALSPRDREILKDVISAYIESGEPVSSRSVAKLERHGLSSASIRNVMADLEEDGYLSQPHTSAGRVPTRNAYRLYINSLMASRSVPERQRRYIQESLHQERDADQLTSATSHLLSELSRQVGIVVTPALAATRLKAVDFVPLSDRRILCVVVSTSGFVDNKVIEVDQPIGRDELVRIGNYLTDNFSGLAIREIRSRLLELMADERAQMDRLLTQAMTLARLGLEEGLADVLVDGANVLLGQPELASLERIRRLFDTFADKAKLVRILNEHMEGNGVRVFIGDEHHLTQDLDFSLVATRYGPPERPLGTLAIFGPSRMDYTRVVPLVDYLGDTLTQALAACFSNER